MGMDFDIFGRNVTDRVSNQKTYYYANAPVRCLLGFLFRTTW